MFYTILFTVVLLAISFLLLAIKIVLKKNGKFVNTHISGNKEMAKRGITCVLSMDAKERKTVNRVSETDKSGC